MSSKLFKKNKADLEKPVTLGLLLEYTDEFLLPQIGNLIDESAKLLRQELKQEIKKSSGQTEYNLKGYIDQKLGEYTTDIFKRLDKKYQRDRQFKQKVVDLFKKHNIGSKEELAFLDGLVSGS